MRPLSRRVCLALAGSALFALAPAASGAVVFSTLSTAEWNFDNSFSGTISQLFTVPANQSWSLDSITLMLGQGAVATGTLGVVNLSATTVYGTTGSETTQVTFGFEPLTFTFATPLTLPPGTYLVRENFGVEANDVFWDANTGAGALQMQLEGSVSPVPEPEQAAVAVAAACGLLAFARRRRMNRAL